MSREVRQRFRRSAGAVDVIVVGAGHAGLAMSRCLAQRGIEHRVLERGEVANTWRRERWPSLRLLTPNWQCRLPGQRYDGPEPDGFMGLAEVIDFITGYARAIDAPVHTRTRVIAVRADDAGGYRVSTDRGDWRCRAVVLASGAFSVPAVPAMAADLPASVASVTPRDYRGPDTLDSGGVLVVGASATGVQLSEEIQRSGRPVTLSVGEHVRLPRVYRGRDIQWWMDAAGILDQRYDEVDDITRARGVPSPQLIGTPERRQLDLNTLREQGVRLVGRVAAVRDGRALFSGSLRNHCALADLKMNRLLRTIDAWALSQGLTDSLPEPEVFPPTRVDETACLTLDLAREDIRTVIWATGFRPDYGWLHLPVFDRKGRLRHDGGVVRDAPGVYALGLPFMRRRKSSFIHGAEDDARELADSVAGHLRATRSCRLGRSASRAAAPAAHDPR